MINDIYKEGKLILKNFKGVLSFCLFLIGIFAFYLLQIHFPELQFLAVIEILTALALGNWWLIDKFMFPEISLQTELKGGNYAFAIAFSAIFLALTIIELAAFTAFITLK